MEMTTVDTNKPFGIVAPPSTPGDDAAWAALDTRYSAAIEAFEESVRIELGSTRSDGSETCAGE